MGKNENTTTEAAVWETANPKVSEYFFRGKGKMGS